MCHKNWYINYIFFLFFALPFLYQAKESWALVLPFHNPWLIFLGLAFGMLVFASSFPAVHERFQNSSKFIYFFTLLPKMAKFCQCCHSPTSIIGNKAAHENFCKSSIFLSVGGTLFQSLTLKCENMRDFSIFS